MTIPNMMTLARIALVPGFLIGIIYGQWSVTLTLFLVAAVTDMLDGFLARRLGQQTRLGFYLDPLADKLLCTVAYVALAVVGLLPAWLAVVVFFKDLFIGLGIAVIYLVGKTPDTMPSFWGKGTTFVQILTIGCLLLWQALGLDRSNLQPLFWTTGLLTIYSGSRYILRGFKQLETQNAPASLS